MTLSGSLETDLEWPLFEAKLGKSEWRPQNSGNVKIIGNPLITQWRVSSRERECMVTSAETEGKSYLLPWCLEPIWGHPEPQMLDLELQFGVFLVAFHHYFGLVCPCDAVSHFFWHRDVCSVSLHVESMYIETVVIILFQFIKVI